MMVLNTGTNSSRPTPRISSAICSPGVVIDSASLLSAGRMISPFNVNDRIISGTSIDTRLGIIIPVIILPAVICPPIHNMIVVTSPIGDHAPPAFAAITTILAYVQRVCWSLISLRSRESITIVVVRLSSTADMKNVRKLIIHSSLTLFVAVILSVIILKPLCLSTISTIVIAANRKNSV